MDLKSLNSVHAVTFEPKGPPQSDWASRVTPTLITRNVPEALWSHKGLTRLERPEAEMIENVPNGVRVALQNREPIHPLAPIELAKFKYETIPNDIALQDLRPSSLIPAQPGVTLAKTI